MTKRAHNKMMVEYCERELKDAQEYLQTCIERNDTHMAEYMKKEVEGIQESLDYFRSLIK